MMIFSKPLREARELLGIDAASAGDARALKRAYRDAVRRSPPDRDPEGFGRVRQAYELLSNPVGALSDRLHHPAPLVPPPAPPPLDSVARSGDTALCLLRLLAARLATDELYPEIAASGRATSEGDT